MEIIMYGIDENYIDDLAYKMIGKAFNPIDKMFKVKDGDFSASFFSDDFIFEQCKEYIISNMYTRIEKLQNYLDGHFEDKPNKKFKNYEDELNKWQYILCLYRNKA
jgi:hypothetical protein